MKLKVGDNVLVRSGRDRGSSGKIIKILPATGKIIVEGVNVLKKAKKPTRKNPRGGISSEPAPIWAATVGIVHPTDSKRSSRIGLQRDKDGQRHRVYRQAKNQEIK